MANDSDGNESISININLVDTDSPPIDELFDTDDELDSFMQNVSLPPNETYTDNASDSTTQLSILELTPSDYTSSHESDSDYIESPKRRNTARYQDPVPTLLTPSTHCCNCKRKFLPNNNEYCNVESHCHVKERYYQEKTFQIYY